MMLRNRSRAVTKPTLMADHSHSSSHSSTNQNCSRVIPSFFDSTKFRDFTIKCLSGTEALTSPTSIIDTRALFTSLGNPFNYNKSKITSENKSSREQKVSKGIGLALIDALKDEVIEDNSSKPRNGKVLFGTQLKPHIPPCPFSPIESQNSAVLLSSALSLSEMELSEDYTCVISRGPNPRTTHIFDNRIVKSYSSGPNSAWENFLSNCYTCKKHLQQTKTKDIYIYRGEKAFCSHECHSRERAEISEFDSYGHS